MAVPMTADQWLTALRAEGVTDIVEMKGWRTHNRGQRGDGWGDVHATMVHHTAGEGPGLPAWCYNGNADLPGPLCHDYLDRTGRLYLVGNGRANHAGMVAENAYQAVLNERSEHPAPGPDARDGNAVSYGLECENSGAPDRPWPAAQYDVAVRVQAARCRHHGWSADSVWAHKEATRRKPNDPRRDMDAFRADVAERLRHPASWNPSDAPAPNPGPTTTEDSMDPVDVWAYHGKLNGQRDPRDAYAYLRDTETRARRLEERLARMEQQPLTDDQVTAIAEAVATAPGLADAIADKLAARLAN